jgi:hypothetical protein
MVEEMKVEEKESHQVYLVAGLRLKREQIF